MATEPILVENKDRFVLFPITHGDIWQMYKKAEASFWTAEEGDLSSDLSDWSQKLSDDERYLIRTVLPFFPPTDGMVNETRRCTSSRRCNTPKPVAFMASR